MRWKIAMAASIGPSIAGRLHTQQASVFDGDNFCLLYRAVAWISEFAAEVK
jgi:hypothetical protein